MQDVEFVNGLIDFIKNSPTPFHAVEIMAQVLERDGFTRLDEAEQWSINNGQQEGRYYVIRNDSSIIAFQLNQPLPDNGMRMVGAHTDSPCLKVKPNPEIINNKYLQLGVEVYGGALLNPWFDRDLSLAGRVSYLDESGAIGNQLINLVKPVATIPSLAIHLDKEANENRSINKQLHLPPVLMKMPEIDAEGAGKADFKDILLKIMNAEIEAGEAVRILDYELSFYDVQPPAVIGLHDDFIASARLDNLLSCYTGLMAMLNDDGKQNTLLVCTDHEEVGSMSAAGAQGSFLKSVLERLCESDENMSRMIANSVMISADNAHGIHPNYADKHDENHGPILNDGPVLKVNANQRYASNSQTGALFRHLCELADVPVQSFVVRSDMACGSTIGPITASGLGVKTVDVGVPTFAMHSIRELAGRWDAYYLYRVLKQFFN
ncbi:MAG: M18 family aminopeptidase [Gammaproteobacteria bacterium]|jgi:aspartyl aminopeptidase|nr:M18 family aminopeptidase [Gammaproteobacteria bacterium]MCW8942245.1 M18 family aminopeptidase [Gammaproteobacteria bacterium]